MNAPEAWHETNARELAGAVADVRQRLERYIQRQSPPPPLTVPATAPAPSAPPKRTSFFRRLLGAGKGSGPSAPTIPPPSGDARAPAPAPTPPSALELLTTRLGLTRFEQQVLLLCVAMEMDTRIASLCAQAQDDPHKPYPTFALAMALFDDPSWDVLSPERPLRLWRMIEISQPGAQPLTSSALRADERIVNYLKGLTYLDDRLSAFLVPFDLEGGLIVLAPSQREAADSILRQLREAGDLGRLPAVQLLGQDPVAKQLVAHGVAGALSFRTCRLSVEMLPAGASDLEAVARLWVRETRLLPLALFLDAEELDPATDRSGTLARFLARTDGICLVGVREVLPRLGRPSIVVDVARPTPDEQEKVWRESLGAGSSAAPALAAQFSLNVPTIQRLAKAASTEASGNDPEATAKRIWDVCCASQRPRLDALAERLIPTAGWEDLVLPAAELEVLHKIAAQVGQRNTVYQSWGFGRKMNRGFGISALFAGPSGAGKTMAAEVIAAGLRLSLYRIDLSAVVNKYIGETEKNLRRLFDAAEDSGAILLFDEADALFGKRSEVKDSHDRYANIEVNYLLQRIESYRGLAILATNMKAALDPAFLRRLRFIVNFPFPSSADRRRIWEKVFLQEDVTRGLATPPLGPLDYDRLARLNLAGGQIHNVALNAAFAAAHAKSHVTMGHILAAARAEFGKLDRPINEADFRWKDPEEPETEAEVPA